MRGFWHSRTRGVAASVGVAIGLTGSSAFAALGPPSIKHPTTAHVFAHVSPSSTAPSAPPSSARIVSRSIGSPTEGRLIGGAHLDDAPYLRTFPCYADRDVRWGLDALVSLLDHAARAVRKQFPDAVMSIGHLSRQGGGEVDRHASHESGRDADVGFYIKNQAGKAIYADHMVAFKADGTAPSWPGAHFDDARNWALVTAMVSDGRARISHLFVATPIRARLLAYAEHIGAPLSVRQRAAEVMAQPHGSLPHDDHFHVRIMCPNAMEGCIELPTAHADRFAHLAKGARGRPRGAIATQTAGSSIAPSSGHSPGVASPAAGPIPAHVPMFVAPAFVAPPAHAGSGAGSGPKGAPKRDNAEAPAIPTTFLTPEEPDFPSNEDEAGQGAAEPIDAPPASMSAPIDDVDGPVPVIPAEPLQK